jgi:predicted Zn finger-like uncharacterized protein
MEVKVMGYLTEKVSYLKGLADGMKMNDSSNEGKLLLAIIDVLDEMSVAVDNVLEIQDEIGEQLDEVDEDLCKVEDILYGEEDDEDEDEDEDLQFIPVECPNCKEIVEIDTDLLDTDSDSVKCPNCGEEIEIDIECDCDCEDCSKED